MHWVLILKVFFSTTWDATGTQQDIITITDFASEKRCKEGGEIALTAFEDKYTKIKYACISIGE